MLASDPVVRRYETSFIKAEAKFAPFVGLATVVAFVLEQIHNGLRTTLGKRLQAQLESIDATALPHAADVARLAVIAIARGEAVRPEDIEPAYLRNDVALTLAQQQALRAGR